MFTLDQVVPIPLHDQIEASEVWQTRCTLKVGQRYFIEAPSGKGKTTLQHILYGLRQDYTGSIQLQAFDQTLTLSELSHDQWASIRQRDLSVIFQDLRLFLDWSAWDNIQLKNALTDHQSEAAIHDMAARLEVDHLLQQKCGELSYGQRQRVAIIRALCQPFRMLLLDEPFAHLDSANIRRCCDLIAEHCSAQGAGFALASLEERYYFEYDVTLRL